MIIKRVAFNIMMVSGLALQACGGGGSSAGSSYQIPVTADLSTLSDGVHITATSCTSQPNHQGTWENVELSSTSTSLLGLTAGGYSATAYCQFTVVSVKDHAARPYDVIVVSGTPTSVAAGHLWPVSSKYPLCVNSTDLSSTANCLSAGEFHADANGSATVAVAIDVAHLWNGVLNMKSAEFLNEIGSSYTGSNQYFAGIAMSVGTLQLVTNAGVLQYESSGNYMNVNPPTGWTCQYLGYENVNIDPSGMPICQ